MRRSSRRILNCVGGRTAADAGVDLALSNPIHCTPDHPPYSEMVSVALQALAEDGGSTESSISAYIQSTFKDLPWGHDRLLPYYLRKLVAGGELTSPSQDRYQISYHLPPSDSLPVRRRGRPRLHHLNPNPNIDPNPRFSPPAAEALEQGRARMHRRRGRPPKIHSEDTPPLHLEQGAPLLRRGRGRGRGRSRRGRGDYIGRMAMRRLSLGLPRSAGLKRRLGSFPDSNGGELNCQLGDSALLDGIKNGGSEYGVLVDSAHIEFDHAGQEHGQPFVAPELSEIDKGQFFGENSALLILEPGKWVPPLGSEHHEHGEGQMLPPFLVPEKTEFTQDQSLLGDEQPLLAPAQGPLLPILAPEIFVVDQGQSMEEELPPFVAPEQTELCQDITKPVKRPPILAPKHFEHAQGQLVHEEAHPFGAPEKTELGQDKVPPFLAPEYLEHDPLQQQQGEASPSMLHEQTELVQKQPSEEHPLLSPEQPEHDHGRPLAAPEESEEGHDQSLPGVEITDFKEGEVVLMPLPEVEEVENASVSSKKRKSHGKRRSLRLWFES